MSERLDYKDNVLVPDYFKNADDTFRILSYHLKATDLPNGDTEYTYELFYEDAPPSIQPKKEEKSPEQAGSVSGTLSDELILLQKKAKKDNIKITLVIFHLNPEDALEKVRNKKKTTVSREFRQTTTLHKALYEFYDVIKAFSEKDVVPRLTYSNSENASCHVITKQIKKKTFRELMNENEEGDFRIYVDLTNKKQ